MHDCFTWQCLLLCGIKNETNNCQTCVYWHFCLSSTSISYFGFHNKATVEFNWRRICTLELYVIFFSFFLEFSFCKDMKNWTFLYLLGKLPWIIRWMYKSQCCFYLILIFMVYYRCPSAGSLTVWAAGWKTKEENVVEEH